MNYKQIFTIFVIFTFIAPLIGLFIQPGNNVTGNAVNEVIGGFADTGNQAIYENNSLVVWMFGLTTCDYCNWEKPVLERVANDFGNSVTLKIYELDLTKDTNKMTSFEQQMFNAYSPSGNVPLIVIGNKYCRVGAGKSFGEARETQYLTELLNTILLSKT